jgi:hypothetical protein
MAKLWNAPAEVHDIERTLNRWADLSRQTLAAQCQGSQIGHAGRSTPRSLIPKNFRLITRTSRRDFSWPASMPLRAAFGL